MTVIAILAFVARIEGTLSYGTILPGVLFAATCLIAKRRTSPDFTWGLFAIAWLIALHRTADEMRTYFDFVGHEPSASRLQQAFVRVYVSTLVLPLFLSIPAAYLAARQSRLSYSFARKWITSCPVVGAINVTVLTVWLFVFAGRAWPS